MLNPGPVVSTSNMLLHPCARHYHCSIGPSWCSTAMFVSGRTYRSAARAVTPVSILLSLVILRSHSKPENIPNARRARMTHRPRKNYRSRSGLRQQAPYLSLTPTDPNVEGRLRSAAASAVRAGLKHATTPKQVWTYLDEAFEKSLVEPSVFGAAMQRCGEQRWWDVLLAIRDRQRQEDVQLGDVERNIFLTALSCSVKLRGSGKLVDERRRRLVEVGRSMWKEVPKSRDARTFNSALSSCFRLCQLASTRQGLRWAVEVWEWSEHQPFPRNCISHHTYVCTMESYSEHATVESLLSQHDLEKDEVMFGGLINCAAEQHDWRRADWFWQTMGQVGVQPNFLVVSAYAKAHLLAGRCLQAASIIEDHLKEDESILNDKLVTDYIQALVVCCHSSAMPAAIERLQAGVNLCAGLVSADSSRTVQTSWKSLVRVSHQLTRDASQFTLHDVLVTHKGWHQSEMRNWPAFSAGTQYLEHAMKLE
eukprot:TRINITY_DN69352_c0_g1_i2.p1 TRINITY_DN69352_c0_g1~~TRINITY_DN69352_c0_g1_i2.p1  ORF type:complete len:479 (-),score=21.87 TRINITY_DN69352_c0_g1_i2:330-1766(-)